MRTTRLLVFSLTTFALLVCFVAESSAQILYIQLASNNPARFQLRQVNGDGSGDVAIGLPFADVRFPAWSRDAGFIAFSSPNPNRPNERSFNVYALNTANGGITQITAFQDIVADSQTGTFRWNYPFHKAFSPNRGAMAVSSLIVQGSRGATTTTTPVLEVYSTATPVNPLLVHVHTNYTGLSHHAGEGVDWSPIQNVLVTPVETSARYQSGGNNFGQVTALYLLDPVDGAIQQGRARQITFPRTDAGSNTSDAFNWSEHDYQPKFSPNGIGVAYVRSFQNFSLSRGGRDPNFQSIRILNLSTGAETEVLQLPQGGYVTSLDWSADGTALVFDFGQQETGVNGLQQNAVAQTNEIYVVNVDGTNVRRLRGAGATTPAWKPLATAPTLINALADTHIIGADASRSTNFGTATGMQTKRTFNAGAGRGRRAFIKFDLSSIASVSNARLRIFARLSDPSLANVPLRIQKVTNTAWDESGMTWNTQPDVASPNPVAPDVVVLDSTGRFYEFDLTSFIQTELAAGRRVVSFRLINVEPTGTSGAFFTSINSKEATNGQPQLVIQP